MNIRSWFDVDFSDPWLLALLAIIPIALWLSLHSRSHVTFSALRLLPASGQTLRTKLAWLPQVLVAAGTCCVIVAAAGPRRGEENSKIRREGIAIVAAIDISGSMLALDLSPPNGEMTRLDAVKAVFARFVAGDEKLKGRGDDAIGLVSFARYADTRSPLTLDHSNLLTATKEMTIVADREEDGTAIGAGLALAVERLRTFKAASKVLVLLTDGVENFHEISVDAAIEDAKKAGVKVYTIGAGSNGVAAVRIPTEDGGSVLRQMQVQIDEETLKQIADKTGGKYFRATSNESLANVYAEIDNLERTEIADTRFTDYHQLYRHWLVAAAILLALGLLLELTWLRRMP